MIYKYNIREREREMTRSDEWTTTRIVGEALTRRDFTNRPGVIRYIEPLTLSRLADQRGNTNPDKDTR